MYHFYNCLNQRTRLLVQEDAFGFFFTFDAILKFDQNIIQKNKKEYLSLKTIKSNLYFSNYLLFI
jgi:hypothetical protein